MYVVLSVVFAGRDIAVVDDKDFELDLNGTD
jgi:hypothetical protein